MTAVIGVAFGGGAVRGLAHVGVLSVLVRERVPIDVISGTSAGAIVGAAYAAGLEIDLIHVLAKRMRWRRIATPVWPRNGLVSFSKLERMMRRLVGDIEFDELNKPLAVVAIDTECGERVMLREGQVARAVRASACVPGIVEPTRVNGRLLGDGGIIDNVPVAAARSLGADYVIGIDVFQPCYRRRLGPLGVGLAAIETMVCHAGGGSNQADLVIEPNLSGKTFTRFSAYRELVTLGMWAAETQMPKLREDLERLGRM